MTNYVNPANSMGSEYNTPKGLDWGRIEKEHKARLTPEQLAAGQAAAVAQRKGGTPAQLRAAAAEAKAKVEAEAAEQEKAS